MPLFLRFENISILHGGLTNDMSLENLSKRDKQKILRMRYLDENHNFLSYGKEDENSVFGPNCTMETKVLSFTVISALQVQRLQKMP